MSKIIAGICTIAGGLLTYYYLFVMENSSWALEYNDPKLKQSMFQTGHMIPLLIGIFMLTVGMIFFFAAKEPNPDIKP